MYRIACREDNFEKISQSDAVYTRPGEHTPRVLAADSRPMIHHRTPQFHVILDNVIEKMKQLFGTTGDVLLVHSTGRGAMEGGLRNVFSPGDADVTEACDLEVQRIFTEWLSPVITEQIDDALHQDPAVKGVTVIHNVTSTAMINPIAEIGNIVRRHERLVLVDCTFGLFRQALCLLLYTPFRPKLTTRNSQHATGNLQPRNS